MIGPVRIDGARLRAWAKGVTISAVRPLWEPQELPPLDGYEGPANLEAIPASVIVAGYAKRNIKTTATFLAVTRERAVIDNRKWAERERLKLVKKSTISPEIRRTLKALEFEGEQDGLIPVMVVTKGVKVEYRGVPVSIPQFPLLNFAVVRKAERAYSVTELLGGSLCGLGISAEAAILDATAKARKLSPERIGEITAKLLMESLVCTSI